jgi:O-acetyl-ADP-ribose deacetylase (regulator of RNase III)
MDYLTGHPEITWVRFVLFGQAAYETYEQALRELLKVYPNAREF